MKKLRVIALSLIFMALMALFAVVPGGSVHPVRATSCTYDSDSAGIGSGSMFAILVNAGHTYGDYHATGGPSGNPAVYNGHKTYDDGAGHNTWAASIEWTSPIGAVFVTSVTYYYRQDLTNVNTHNLYAYDHDNNTPYFASGTTLDGNWHATTISINVTTSRVIAANDLEVNDPSPPALTDQGATAGFSITFDCGSFTPTPSPSPTPTSPPSAGGSAFLGQCPLLGDTNALFANLPGTWTINPTTVTNPIGSTLGLKWSSLGTAQQVLHLSRYHQFSIQVRFHLNDTASSIDHFSATLGGSTSVPIPVTLGSSAEQSFSSSAANYIPDPDTPPESDQFTFTLSYGVGSNVDWVLDFACVQDVTPGAVVVPSGGTNNAGICQDCQYHATGNLINDLLAIFAWLWCGLSQLFDCVLKSMLLGIWQVILNGLQIIGFVRIWLGTIIGNLIFWLNANWGVIVAWARGALVNIIQVLFNVGIFLLNLFPVVGFINLILSFFGTPLGALIANTAHTAGAVVATGGDIIQIGATYIGQIVTAIISLLGVIPTVIAAIINGFNNPSTSIPVYAPACSSANTFLFYPCLGSYILDNTLLDGPVYLMFLMMLGLVAINVLLWAVRAVQEALGK